MSDDPYASRFCPHCQTNLDLNSTRRVSDVICSGCGRTVSFWLRPDGWDVARAYGGDPQRKRDFLATTLPAALQQGLYFTDSEGGCSADDRLSYEMGEGYGFYAELGLPAALASLVDRIYVGLAEDRKAGFATAFFESIPVGAELGEVWPRFAIWLLTDGHRGVIQFADSEACRSVIQRVADLYQSRGADFDAWSEAWETAEESGSAPAASFASQTAAHAAACGGEDEDGFTCTQTADASEAAANAFAAAKASAFDRRHSAAASQEADRVMADHYLHQSDKLLDLVNEVVTGESA